MNTPHRRTRRVRRSPEQREELLRRFHAGDSPQADFCREHDVHPATLSQWLRKSPAPAFHEVVLPPRPQAALEVALDSGAVLRVADPAWLVPLLRALRETALC